MSEPGRDRINFEALADFRYAIRRYLNFSERNARADGLEPQQYQALLAIKGVPPAQKATVGVLAEHLQIQHHSAVELMDRLEKRGLVRRARSRVEPAASARATYARGRTKLKRVSMPHRDELRTGWAEAASRYWNNLFHTMVRAPTRGKDLAMEAGAGAG